MIDKRAGAGSGEVYLTVNEVAYRLRISRWKVYELIRLRELESFRVGRCRRVPASAVETMVNRLMKNAA
jgi:excisionase family DNA binding protein